MSLNTSLKGRLRNTNLPKTNILFPLFEAVINSIHAIDERIEKQHDIDIGEGYIKIKVKRSTQLNAENSVKPKIVGFEIVDNGIGFNEDNFNSFQTLDSDYKIKLGGRGVGRLLWLKAFKKVNIISIFKENYNIQKRSFDFNIQNDLHNHNLIDSKSSVIETTVNLEFFNKEYEKYLPKAAIKIAHALLEHCLWYFLRSGGAPDITVMDVDETILLNKEYESFMFNASESIPYKIKSRNFELMNIKLRSTFQNKHSVIYSAANRVVREESLVGKIPGLFGVLKDGDESFCYLCFVTSEYLTESVNSERIGFNISESIDDLFVDEEISFSEIRNETIKHITKYLEKFLIENKQIGLKKLTDFVANKAPRFRPILSRIPENEKIVDPNITDKELELKLHTHLMVFENELLTEGHDLMKPHCFENDEEYSRRIEEYLLKVSDIKKSDLANYVAHRKVILDLLEKSIQIKKDGKYLNEEVLHKLIMPMQKNSNELMFDDSNLWLVDERLAFHNYLASDKSIKSMPITNSEEKKEPDLLALNIYENPLLVNEGQSLPLASITVIEIKKPMRNDAKQGEDKDPIEQALGYLKRVRNGGAKTELGRQIPDSSNIPGFCYIISDITDTIKERCEILDLTVSADKLGYFGYHKTYNAYIEVLSFDRLLNMAKERNRSFFDKLGLPSI
ncbi:MAG TPA: ATP-binding protein [bacterium]|nr:ATP-binding protein [bacterium]HPN45700.1 ATP-binding protein [bacterium]